jgi:hypothetical protein
MAHRRRNEIPRFLLRRRRNTRRLIDDEGHREIARRQAQAHARERADEQEENQ